MGPATYAYVIKYTNAEKPDLGIQTQYCLLYTSDAADE